MPLVFLPQILWHSKDNKQCDRVYSLDFHPFLAEPSAGSTRTFKLATGGADEFVHVWQVSIHENVPQYATHKDKSILAPENQVPRPGQSEQKGDQNLQPFTVKVLARLVGHIGEVNAVRWNPNGVILASGGEDRCIFLWCRAEKGSNLGDASGQEFEEHYTRFQYYRLSHVVNSISWCPEGRLLAVATEDGHVSLIDTFVEGVGRIRHFEGHTSFAQGVAMCPQNTLLASMGQDQTLRIWKRRSEKQWKSILVLRSAKDQSDFKESIGMESDDVRYSRSVFMSEELSTFFRRLDWSPDGRFLVTPAGIRHSNLFKKEDEPEVKAEPSYTLYVFHRKLINRGLPMVTHQSPTGPFVVVKFCSLDLSRIEKEKVNFFNKIFKGKGRGRKVKIPKAPKVEKIPDTSDQQQNTMECDSIKIEDQGPEDPNESLKEVDTGLIKDEPSDVVKEETGYVVKEETSDVLKEETSNVIKEETSDLVKHEAALVTDIKENPQEDDAISAEVKQNSLQAVSGKSIEVFETCKEELPEGVAPLKKEPAGEIVEPIISVIEEPTGTMDISTLESDASQRIDTSYGNESNEEAFPNEEERVEIRTSKREIKRPSFYEADISIYQELSKSTRPKPNKKDEDKEYDTDAEDEVVIPRIMFAAGTLDGSLCFYDTGEDKGPIAVLKNLHYCAINDIAWSPDGLVCATASSDGYVTFVVFQKKDFY